MDVALFDYQLPPELIAQEPAFERAASRMLVMPRSGPLALQDRMFRELPDLLRPGDCVVLNDTRVIPARLIGRRAGGGQAEVLLLHDTGDGLWEALVRPGAKLRPGAMVTFGTGELQAEVIAMEEGGLRRVRLEHEGDLMPLLDRLGETPLPPYIRRAHALPEDRERYQTVYAKQSGAAAAPTAGLHFDEAVLRAISEAGAEICCVTLHVGLGTFRPVSVRRVEDHRMHAEWCEVSEAAAEAIARTRAGAGRIVAIGTTVVRTLESRADQTGQVQPGAGMTDLFITPGYRFRVVDALLTNFHLPCSTLLMLVAAFCGRERTLEAYRHAIAEQYRFYSYGDCMFIG